MREDRQRTGQALTVRTAWRRAGARAAAVACVVV